jgi:hypothetical protein
LGVNVVVTIDMSRQALHFFSEAKKLRLELWPDI